MQVNGGHGGRGVVSFEGMFMPSCSLATFACVLTAMPFRCVCLVHQNCHKARSVLQEGMAVLVAVSLWRQPGAYSRSTLAVSSLMQLLDWTLQVSVQVLVRLCVHKSLNFVVVLVLRGWRCRQRQEWSSWQGCCGACPLWHCRV